MSHNFLQVAQGRELWFITSSHSMAVMCKVGYMTEVTNTRTAEPSTYMYVPPLP